MDGNTEAISETCENGRDVKLDKCHSESGIQIEINYLNYQTLKRKINKFVPLYIDCTHSDYCFCSQSRLEARTVTLIIALVFDSCNYFNNRFQPNPIDIQNTHKLKWSRVSPPVPSFSADPELEISSTFVRITITPPAFR